MFNVLLRLLLAMTSLLPILHQVFLLCFIYHTLVLDTNAMFSSTRSHFHSSFFTNTHGTSSPLMTTAFLVSIVSSYSCSVSRNVLNVLLRLHCVFICRLPQGSMGPTTTASIFPVFDFIFWISAHLTISQFGVTGIPGWPYLDPCSPGLLGAILDSLFPNLSKLSEDLPGLPSKHKFINIFIPM